MLLAALSSVINALSSFAPPLMIIIVVLAMVESAKLIVF